MSLGTYMGLSIFINDLLVEDVPVRVHKERLRVVHCGWMSGTVPARGPNYHKRIQKKWIKRWGTKKQYNCVMIGSRVFMHSMVYEELKPHLTIVDDPARHGPYVRSAIRHPGSIIRRDVP